MVAGMFSNCGYFQGNSLIPAKDSNPKGFFEDWKINLLNERILRSSLLDKFGLEKIKIFDSLFGDSQYWLAHFPDDIQIVVSDADRTEIASLVDKTPFCFKDPRFSYTLPLWLEASPETVAICVFRHPGIVIASILKELQSNYLIKLNIRVCDLYAMWEAIYLQVLRLRSRGVEVYFVNYLDLFSQNKQVELEKLIGSNLNRSFLDLQFNRTEFSGELPARTAQIFDSLKLLASQKFSEQSPDKCKILVKRLAFIGNKATWPANVSELAEARECLADERQRVVNLQETNKTLDSELAEARERLADERQRVVNLQETNKTLDSELAEARERLADERQRVVNLQETNKTLDSELAEARERLADQNQRIEAYEQSISWRITQPMRTFKKWLIRLKR